MKISLFLIITFLTSLSFATENRAPIPSERVILVAEAVAESYNEKIDGRCYVQDGDGRSWIFPFGAKYNSRKKKCSDASDHYGVGIVEKDDGEIVASIIDI